ncbi:MAG: oligoendopeptidase F [bacterium]|nr:oligoendopeptidase F [bacterium]
MKLRNLLFALVAVLMISSVVLAADMPQRSDIPDEYKWKPEHIYASIDAWEADFSYLEGRLDEIVAYKGTFAGEQATDPAKSLIAYNKLTEELMPIVEKLWVYVMYNYHVDLSNSDWAGMQQRIQTLYIDFSSRMAWYDPELLRIPQETMHRYIDKNPELEDYRKSYDDLYAQQAHVLTEAEEQIIALSYNITGTASDVFGKLTDVDMKFGSIDGEGDEKIEVTDSGWNSWRVDKNREIREAYFKKLWEGYQGMGTTLAALMNGNIKKNVYMQRARKYDNTLQAALDGNFIPEDVYINLVKTTRANLAPLHKYNEIRKRVLGVDHYRHWDYYVSLAEMPEERYEWNAGADMIFSALKKPLGKQYNKDIQIALDPKNGWVDVYANDNKRGGAYSSSCYGVHPYMLYNFDYNKGLTLEDVSTIAHEVGHAMHTWYSEKSQALPNKDYAIFNAEVASTTNEAIFTALALEKARQEYKNAKGDKQAIAKQKLIALLDGAISSARTTFYRQTMFATWEWEANKMGEQGMPLTVESLSDLYYSILTEFHGPAAEYEEISAISWARIPHFYRGYYVYSYATSYAAAVALAKDLMENKPGAQEAYINYLESGSSKHPVELLKDAGVDMATPAPIEAFVAYVGDLVDELDVLTQ